MGLELYVGRVAVVTGASSEIGAAVTKALLRNGIHVVGLARRVDRVQALNIPSSPGKLHAVQCDLTSENDILEAFNWVKEKLGSVDVLINCAQIQTDKELTSGTTSEWKKVLDVNVIGLSICTREAVKDMKARGFDGYIIHVNSVSAHVPPQSKRAMYYATKYAVKALSVGLRADFYHNKIQIRHTMISRGPVRPMACDVFKSSSPILLDMVPLLEAEDIADLVIFILSQPRIVEIHDIIVNPTGKSYLI